MNFCVFCGSNQIPKNQFQTDEFEMSRPKDQKGRRSQLMTMMNDSSLLGVDFVDPLGVCGWWLLDDEKTKEPIPSHRGREKKEAVLLLSASNKTKETATIEEREQRPSFKITDLQTPGNNSSINQNIK